MPDIPRRIRLEWKRLKEKTCAACGHSEARHQTAGGFCKHCPCEKFIEDLS